MAYYLGINKIKVILVMKCRLMGFSLTILPLQMLMKMSTSHTLEVRTFLFHFLDYVILFVSTESTPIRKRVERRRSVSPLRTPPHSPLPARPSSHNVTPSARGTLHYSTCSYFFFVIKVLNS